MFFVRDDFAAVDECAQVAAAWPSVAERSLAGPEAGQRAIAYGSLRATTSGADSAGRPVYAADDETRLKLWLNTLRASALARAGYRGPALFPELTVLAELADGAAMSAHVDHPWRAASAILYLTDGLDGGLTMFEGGEAVAPRAGRLVLFAGSRVRHWVTPVSGGVRRTVSLWWSTDPARLEA